MNKLEETALALYKARKHLKLVLDYKQSLLEKYGLMLKERLTYDGTDAEFFETRPESKKISNEYHEVQDRCAELTEIVRNLGKSHYQSIDEFGKEYDAANQRN